MIGILKALVVWVITNHKKLVPWVAGGLALAGAALMLVPSGPVRGFEL